MNFKDILKIDYLLLLPVIILLVLGILFIYSSGITSTGVQVSREYIRQIIWASSGLVIAIIIAFINYRRFYNLSLYIYLGSLAPLIYTLVIGRATQAARWLRIGAFGVQTSEFVKISVIILLARYLADTERNSNSFSRFIVCCLIVFFPTGLVLIQPDLGTSLVYMAILLIMIFVAGVSMRYVAFMGITFLLSAVFLVLPLWQTHILRRSVSFLTVLTNPRILTITIFYITVILSIALFGFLRFKRNYFYWIAYVALIIVLSLGVSYAGRLVLKNYQLMRLIVFLDPNVDPRGAGWNIIQSITAIGAGGLTGRGYLQGTQSHYRFLPEQSTDFIFSIFSEEAGFIGGLLVFGLYLLINIRLLKIMKITADPFARYICAGLAGMFSFHFIVNVGMTMGIMPITGLPLILMSYGGSSVFTAMAGIGLALSIYIRRYNR